MKLKSRKTNITPVLPTSASTLQEDKVNPDNAGLYMNLAKKDEYWTYNRKVHEISILRIRHDKSEVVEVITSISEDQWNIITRTMKEMLASDSEDK